MLFVQQTRTIQWEQEASDLDDTTMVFIASTLLNQEEFWADLEDGQTRSHTISYQGANLLVIVTCLSPADDLLLQILNAQFM